MEDLSRLIRIENDYDRQVLLWLRRQVGDDAIRAAVGQLGGKTPPYLSVVCRALHIRPPARRAFRAANARISRAVGDRYLARIREILSPPDSTGNARHGGSGDTSAPRGNAAPEQRTLPFGGAGGPWQMA